MVVGYNHNIKYKGEIFHIQTEDSGINNPHIITLLYRGGNIIASKKTSYADIVKMDNLTQIVEELMKEQHKDMLRRLKNSEFDSRLGLGDAGQAEPSAAAVTVTVPEPVAEPVPPAAAPEVTPEATVTEPEQPASVDSAAEAPSVKKQSLDDIIFEFLSSGDEHK
ncbi:MAG TPA: hypothetical protein VFF53_03700 [Geobacteraceae bacterium]|nr:hypothetical protein [Geobacteraceae bacterium]